jgi:prevent-host-death family protein
MDHWQLKDAKNRFSEIVNKALRDGPQVVTRRGKKTVVIISA